MAQHDVVEPWHDPVVAELESVFAAAAFARLPDRWQTVLWLTEVEQKSPTDLAPLLGLTPNGVAAVALSQLRPAGRGSRAGTAGAAPGPTRHEPALSRH